MSGPALRDRPPVPEPNRDVRSSGRFRSPSLPLRSLFPHTRLDDFFWAGEWCLSSSRRGSRPPFSPAGRTRSGSTPWSPTRSPWPTPVSRKRAPAPHARTSGEGDTSCHFTPTDWLLCRRCGILRRIFHVSGPGGRDYGPIAPRTGGGAQSLVAGYREIGRGGALPGVFLPRIVVFARYMGDGVTLRELSRAVCCGGRPGCTL